MKYGGLEVQLGAVLVSALGAAELSASRPSRFASVERTCSNNWIGVCAPEPVSTLWKKEENQKGSDDCVFGITEFLDFVHRPVF
jgi:hypothetical protein